MNKTDRLCPLALILQQENMTQAFGHHCRTEKGRECGDYPAPCGPGIHDGRPEEGHSQCDLTEGVKHSSQGHLF